MRDLINNISVKQLLNPAVATTTRTSTGVDLQGYNAASVVFTLGTSGDTLSGSIFWTLKLQHSDDDSVYTDAVAADTVNGVVSTVVNNNTLDETTYSFSYNGAKRYLRGVATPTGTHSVGTPIGVIALRGTAGYAPVS